MKYRKEVDGLRALAVLPVILFHAGFASFSGGFVGVDIFFVISGYLITTIVISELSNDKFSLVKFYERRARRVLPALFFVMTFSTIFSWFWLLPSDLKDFSQSLVAVSVFASNILFWRESGYFEVAAELKPLLHTWSLAVEEQFYIFFPLFLMVAWRFGKLFILIALTIVFAVSLVLAQWASTESPGAGFYLLPTRGWELLVGAFSAFFLSRNRALNFSMFQRELAGWLGVSLILYSVFAFDKETPFPSFYALVPTVGTALIIIFTNTETVVGKFVGNRLFVGVGLISYSAYLWHQPLFAFARHRNITEPSELVFLVLSVISLILAYFSWRYIEAPFRNKLKFSRKKIFSLSLMISFIFISLGLLGHYFSGFGEARFSEQQMNVINSVSRSPKREDCHFPQDESALSRDACTFVSDNVSVAVMGNSHATELAYSLAKLFSKYGVGVVQHTISGCRHNYLVADDAQPVCAKWHNKVFNEISNDSAIKNVILSYRNEQYLNDKVYRDSLIGLATDLVGSGKNVVLVLQAPLPLVHINQHLSSNMPDLSKPMKSRKKDDWLNLYRYSEELINGLPPEVSVIAPSDIFCDSNYCYVAKNGQAFFFDDNHMSVYGSRLVAEKITSLLQED